MSSFKTLDSSVIVPQQEAVPSGTAAGQARYPEQADAHNTAHRDTLCTASTRMLGSKSGLKAATTKPALDAALRMYRCEGERAGDIGGQSLAVVHDHVLILVIIPCGLGPRLGAIPVHSPDQLVKLLPGCCMALIRPAVRTAPCQYHGADCLVSALVITNHQCHKSDLSKCAS